MCTRTTIPLTLPSVMDHRFKTLSPLTLAVTQPQLVRSSSCADSRCRIVPRHLQRLGHGKAGHRSLVDVEAIT